MGKTAVKGLFHLILIATTFALAVVTIIASRSGHYHPEHSTIMPLLGLAVPVLLVSCLIVALCWALARRKWAFVTLTAFFFNWEYLTAVIRFGSPQEVPAIAPAPNRQGENSGYLTVATYNVHNFGNEITGYSCKQIAKYMQSMYSAFRNSAKTNTSRQTVCVVPFLTGNMPLSPQTTPSAASSPSPYSAATRLSADVSSPTLTAPIAACCATSF